jgi:hypothetical protein
MFTPANVSVTLYLASAVRDFFSFEVLHSVAVDFTKKNRALRVTAKFCLHVDAPMYRDFIV